MALTVAMFFLVVLCSPPVWCAERNAKTLAGVEALTSFKINLHDPLGALGGWDSSTPSAPCDWHGVACENNRVTELSLPGLQLGGRLSDRLGDLGMLRNLSLQSNFFSGEIPWSIANLSRLRFINLSYNQFAGRIPASFGELQELQYLSLENNLLEGTIPSAIANCSSLVHLSAGGNSLSGVVPSALGTLPNLRVLMLSHNNLSGSVPGSVLCHDSDHPPSLRIVHLGFNALTYIVNPDMETCYSVLQVLDLQHNQIRGLFPPMITQIFTLTVVDLSNNLFSGVIPADIGNLTGLEELNIANNSFSGRLPTEIKQCHSLRVLIVQGNHFYRDGGKTWLLALVILLCLIFLIFLSFCWQLSDRVSRFVKSYLKRKIVPSPSSTAEDGGQPL